MNWTIIIIVGILGIVIVIFTLFRNLKDKKDLEEKFNNDYPKKIDKKGEIDEDGL
jgi:FtsZ-interacting cell division protein ZipA